jgi:hypothetical protein
MHVPIFNVAEDPQGVRSHVPYMDHFYDNSLQTELMRDLAVDLELLGEHVVLLGNQVCLTCLVLGLVLMRVAPRESGKTRLWIGEPDPPLFIL